MPQFDGMHVALPLGSHYSSWVSRRDNHAPLVSVCGAGGSIPACYQLPFSFLRIYGGS